MSNRIGKSKFVAGCQCLKRLYLQVHEPELTAEPDSATEAIIEQGREVGRLARPLFPGEVEVCSEHGLNEASESSSRSMARIFRALDGLLFRRARNLVFSGT